MSITTTTHLNFRGDARAALEFYQAVFGGEITLVTYQDAHNVQDPSEATPGLRRSLVMSGSSKAMLRSCVAASGACSPSRWRSSMWWSGGRGARVPSGGDRASQGRTAGAG
jgi:hypothetical protein